MSLTPIWKLLIDMLRPMDFVSLAIVTKFRVQPTNEQMRFYMKWQRQTFYDIKWVEKNGREIVVIGKDLVWLNCTIKRQDYFDTTKIKLLVIVKETLPMRRDITITYTLIYPSYRGGACQKRFPLENWSLQIRNTTIRTLTGLSRATQIQALSQVRFESATGLIHKPYSLGRHISTYAYRTLESSNLTYCCFNIRII